MSIESVKNATTSSSIPDAPTTIVSSGRYTMLSASEFQDTGNKPQALQGHYVSDAEICVQWCIECCSCCCRVLNTLK